MEILAEFSRVVLMATFAAAASSKFLNPEPLARDLRPVGFGRLSLTAVYGLASAEATVSFGLAIGRVEAAAAAALLLAVFSIWLIARPSSDCGCGLPGSALPTPHLLLRNAALGAAAGVVIWQQAPATPAATTAAALLIIALVLAIHANRRPQDAMLQGGIE